MESWSIEVNKEYFKFSAAHFLIFADGTAERLHGHNYRVFLELDACLDDYGLVMDFKRVKPVVLRLLETLDERFLLPGEHPELRVSDGPEGRVSIHYRERFYQLCRDEVLVLPITNTSSENLATFIGRELLRLLPLEFSEVQIKRLRLAVEETSGQRGVYRFESDSR
ncbi:MAG: 6-carboxytetrahydropterin synthase [bacterium]|jgi:6-pyruvoyltetrahydropterin/6-carboxytetrahydropterin synthase|nr:6-pyruvoyl tetrahydrobiopterin synthase [Planctomycetota bacterium]HIL50673.1 6-pyruvoyl tetrahydrobiopterin synthase [Planctomycetota bacterium]